MRGKTVIFVEKALVTAISLCFLPLSYSYEIDEIAAKALSGKIDEIVSLTGPYKFSYVNNTPDRLFYVHNANSNTADPNKASITFNSLPENTFGPSNNYLSLIGSYWLDEGINFGDSLGPLKYGENDSAPTYETVTKAFNGTHLTVTLGTAENSKEDYFFFDITAANQDKFNAPDIDSLRKSISQTFLLTPTEIEKYKFSTVQASELQINIAPQQSVHFQRIVAGKTLTWLEINNANDKKPWTNSYNNKVTIQGAGKNSQEYPTLFGQSVYDLDRDTAPTGIGAPDYYFYYRSNITGGAGFVANSNLVEIDKLKIQDIDRKYGIIGGRANDGNRFIKNTLYGCTAWGNGIKITNSLVGYNTFAEQVDDGRKGINIYGGISYGQAANNYVILRNSSFDGNVYGAIAGLGSLLDACENLDNKNVNAITLSRYDYTKDNKWDGKGGTLNNAQLLYLYNKAENQYSTELDGATGRINKNFNYSENNAATLNFWPGLSDDNYVSLDGATLIRASSVYASSGMFIPYDSTNNAFFFNDAQAVNLRRGKVYITGGNITSSLYAKEVYFGTFRNEKGVEENGYKPIQLGSNVSSSYINNISGFHSELSSKTNAQSNITDGYHNFWSKVHVNLGNTINGNGKELHVTSDLEFTNGVVQQKDFSVLALDNPSDDPNEFFKNAPKVYVGVTEKGVDINWSRIARYRLSFASGGQYLDPTQNYGENAGWSTKFEEDPLVNKYFTNGSGLPFFINAQSPLPVLVITAAGEEVTAEQPHYFTYDEIFGKDSKISEQGIKKLLNSHFKITGLSVQQKDGPNGSTREAAKATFDVSQYLNFEQYTTDENGEVVSRHDHAGGIGFRYRLTQLDLVEGNQMILYGQEIDNHSVQEDLDNQPSYTLTAILTGKGGLILDINNRAYIETQTDDQGNARNAFTGIVTARSGSELYLKGNGSLGNNDVYASGLYVDPNAHVSLNGYQQRIGNLVSYYGSAINFDSEDASKAGNLGLIQIIGKTDDITTPNSSYISGSLNGSENAVFSVRNGTLSVDQPTGFKGSLKLLSGKVFDTADSETLNATTAYLAHGQAFNSAKVSAEENTAIVFDDSLKSYEGSSIVKPVRDNQFSVQNLVSEGTIYLSNPTLYRAGKDFSAHTVTANSFAGSSTLVFTTMFRVNNSGLTDNSPSDKLVVLGQASGQHKVIVNAAPGSRYAYTSQKGGILIAETPNADPDFSLGNLGIYAISGASVLSLTDEGGDGAGSADPSKVSFAIKSKENKDDNEDFRGNPQGGKYWYLTLSKGNTDPTDEGKDPTDENDPQEQPEKPKPSDDLNNPDHPINPSPSDGGNSSTTPIRGVVGAYAANVLAWGQMDMRLHDRIGESYFIDPETHEIKKAAGWVRIKGAHQHLQTSGALSKTRGNYSTTQIGADLIRKDLNEDWRVVGGVFFGNLYGKTKTKAALDARSRVEGYGGGAYVTLFSSNTPDNGFYADIWVSYNRFKNKIYGDEPDFSYHSRGFTYSGELGYTIHAATTGSNEKDRVEWFIQPQFQAIAQTVKASNKKDYFGNEFKQNGKNNVQLRLGARIFGRQTARGNVFVEGNWIHNTKDIGVEAAGRRVLLDGVKNSGEARIGWEGNISKNILGSITGTVRAGHRGYNEESANISIRYMF